MIAFKRRLVGLFVALAYAVCSFAQELPPIQNFAPANYKAENQNWAISQSKEKLIYVANNKGLLEFNGANWTLFPSPNETIIRSVKVVGDKIYTGCYEEFGYWIPNEWGALEYRSLSEPIKQKLLDDEEFWNIEVVQGAIVFQSKKRIYIYDLAQQSVNSIPAETALPRIFNVDQKIYFQKENKGLYSLVGGKATPFITQGVVVEDEVINIFERNGELLLLTRDSGFYRVVGDSLIRWEITADELLQQCSIYSAIALQDGTIALGTIANGFILLDQNGDLLYAIDQIQGLRNNTVLSIFEDMDNNVWLGLDNGISHINLKSPYRVYHDNKGEIGSVYTAIIWNGILYLGTNQGLYYRPIQNSAEFALIAETEGQVWSLQAIQDQLLCGHHSGTFLVEGSTARRIVDIPGTWKIDTLESPGALVLQGNYDGLYVLENSNGQWGVRNKIEGFDYSSRYFEVLDQTIFVNHEYKGVFQITTDYAFSKAATIELDSLTPGFNSGISIFQDALLYAHKSGVKKYDQKQATFVKDTILSKVYASSEYVSGKMVVDNDDQLWFFSKDRLSRVSLGSLANTPVVQHIPLKETVRNGVIGYESISMLEDQKFLLGTSMGYITLDVSKLAIEDFEVQVSSVFHTSKNQPGMQDRPINTNATAVLQSDENSLGISFYTAHYDWYAQPNYQFKLSNAYPDWSEWSESATVHFENLDYGEYTFSVRSKIGDTLSSNTASYVFRIKKPWYRSDLALLTYVLLAVIAGMIIHVTYRGYYKKRQQQLIEVNQRELDLTKAKNEKEIIKIKNQQLQREFRSKSNELAASTLSIIKKNELLTKVKEELLSNGGQKDFIHPIIAIIDKSLNKSDDWELFKEAFNNADRKFLKKLKKAHPNLSPNDIKLCAYLRLNLSSKEIAPMLNISSRSVEIKRYRLRKKMSLSHDDNLVDYILKL